jgi:uncharacterized protein (DUF305 family)
MTSCRRLLPLLCLLAACASSARPAPQSAARPAGRTDAEIEALYQARLDSARTRFTPADAEFMTGMIAHHAQALTMAAMAPTHGASPTIRTLAARIENAQNGEIRLMQRWLRDRDLPVPELHRMGGRVMVHGADHDMSMPGMLTPEQMAELDHARGEEFDRLFLTYMIQHHRGAIVMVRELFGTDGAGQDEAAFKLASDVQVDQKTEIARMEQLLSRLPAR